MKLFFASVAMLVNASLVSAAVVDSWSVDKYSVGVSTAKKEDGSVIEADPTKEVLLTLGLKTRSQYGANQDRDIKTKSITAPEGQEVGIIKLEIQSDIERECADLENGGLGVIPMISAATADVRLVLKPGIYHLFVDSISLGLLNVVNEAAQFVKDPNYDSAIGKRSSAELEKIFGPMEGTIKGKDCSVELKVVDATLVADYVFPSKQETLANGDILIRKEVKGSVKVKSQRTSSRCELGAKRGDPYSIQWSLELGTENGGRIKFDRYSANSPVSASFSIEQKYCSQNR